jgi:hypothetical protein
MKTLARIGACLSLLTACSAQPTLADYDWQKLAEAGQSLGGTLTNIGGKAALKISNTNQTALRVELLKITNPPVTKTLYAILGEMKYEGVQGDGYLEMWNCFAPRAAGMPEGHYFSKTLAESGDMGKITGTSNWRSFTLPFNRAGTSNPPTRLELNLILLGSGDVYLSNLRLIEYTGNNFGPSRSSSGAWWSDSTAGLIGGITGGTVGSLASLLAWLASKGKSRSFVLGASVTLIGLGIVSTLAGVGAIYLNQPYAVWFPLLLIGVILVSVLPARLKQFQKQYEEIELRRIASCC